MMTRFRKDYEKWSIPLGKISVSIGMKPDFWTAISILSGIASGILFGYKYLWWGLLLMLVMIFTDILDGATARAGNLASPYGGVLDHTIDRYAEFFLVGGLMAGGYISPIIALFVASGMIMASYVRAAAESIGGLENCVVGMAGRQEKFILMIIGILLFGVGQNTLAQIPIILIGVISHITAIQRLAYSIKHSVKKP